MSEQIQIFAFEEDFSHSLRCIPMAIRFKLDQCGVKLSLRQWSQFLKEDRALLLKASCQTAPEIVAYTETLVHLIGARSDEPPRFMPPERGLEWAEIAVVPTAIHEQARTLGISPPSVDQWAGLTVLPRFVLLKLTRPGHDNENFVPAMIEFGLLRP
jgi:hypothetical protein